jgi:hypothetical protein
VRGPDLNQEIRSTTAWPIGTDPSKSGLASTSGTYAAKTPSWTTLFTHSMSVLSGSGEISADKDRDGLTAHVVPRGSPRGLEDTDYNPDQPHFTDRGCLTANNHDQPHFTDRGCLAANEKD